MRLSIIIPHFNSPILLRKLLLSIPICEDIQIIVVDDNSTKYLDDYQTLIEDHRFSSILFLENKNGKKGAGTCRNIGLSAAKGDWILFADADDFFTEGFYKILKQYFDSKNNVVFFIPTSIELDTGQPSDRHIGYKNIIENYLCTKSATSILHLRYRFTVPWSKLIRRNFISENNIVFDETLASNDMMFSAKIGYNMETFEVSNQVIYCVTRSKGTLTRNIKKPIFNARLDVFIRTYNFLKRILTREELKALNLTGRGYVNNAFRHKLGIKKVLSTFLILKRNRIPVFERKLLSFSYIYQRIKRNKEFKEKEGKYFTK